MEQFDTRYSDVENKIDRKAPKGTVNQQFLDNIA